MLHKRKALKTEAGANISSIIIVQMLDFAETPKIHHCSTHQIEFLMITLIITD